MFSFAILVFHLNMFSGFLLDFVLINNEKLNVTQLCQTGFLCFICFVSWEFSSASFIHFLVWLLFLLLFFFVLFVERFLDDMNLDCTTGIMRVLFFFHDFIFRFS